MQYVNNILDCIWSNKEWIFSGIGITVISVIVYFFNHKNKDCKSIRMIQKSGENSTMIQIGGSYNDRKN
jgi:hypothetical protein